VLTLFERVHGKAKSLDDIRKGLFCSRLRQYFGEELFAVGPVQLYFNKWVFLLEAGDHRVGFLEIHRGIEDHLALLFCSFDPWISACRR
jgi:hypothetical protein